MKQRLNCWASSYKAFPSFSRHLATRAEREAWTPMPSAHAHWDAVLDSAALFGSPTSRAPLCGRRRTSPACGRKRLQARLAELANLLNYFLGGGAARMTDFDQPYHSGVAQISLRS
jgi:hypothetical protein